MKAPEGWKLVPVEPTPEMHRAAKIEVIANGSDLYGTNIYEAMLAAAPTPPAEAIPSNPGELKGEPVQATQQLTPLEKLRAMIRNDWYACSFQSMGQYRDALLKASKPEIAAPASPSRPDDAAVRQTLEWYEQQVRDCRKVTGDGEVARHALDNDGGLRARAALASAPADPVQGVATVTLTGRQLADALELLAPDAITVDRAHEQMDGEVSIGTVQQIMDDDGQASGPHLCAWLTEYPEEGCTPLDIEQAADTPADEGKIS